MFSEINREYLLVSLAWMAKEGGYDLSDKATVVRDATYHFEAKHGAKMPAELVQVISDTFDEFRSERQ